jgi:hypothetical protein
MEFEYINEKCMLCNQDVSNAEFSCMIQYQDSKMTSANFHFECLESITPEKIEEVAEEILDYAIMYFHTFTKKRLIQIYKEILKPIGLNIEKVYKLRRAELLEKMKYGIELSTNNITDPDNDYHMSYIDLTNIKTYLDCIDV